MEKRIPKNVPVTDSTEFKNPSYQGRHPIEQDGGGEGEQRIWRFNNGYGASVVRFGHYPFDIMVKIWNSKTTIEQQRLKKLGHKELSKGGTGSYGFATGHWELAVLKFDNKGGYELCYGTPVTNDIMGYLTPKGIEGYLKKIKMLPPGGYQSKSTDNSSSKLHGAKNSSENLQSNCSEMCFRLTGSFKDIKEQVMSMVDCIERDRADSNYPDEKKMMKELRDKIKAIKNLSEFNFFMIEFTTNYKTFFREKDGDLLVATCNNIEWDDIDYILEDESYYNIAGHESYIVYIIYDKYILLRKQYWRSSGDKEFVIIVPEGMDLKEGEKIEVLERNNNVYVLSSSNKYFELEKLKDKELKLKMKLLAGLKGNDKL
jgi:hypothetical protein